MPRLPVLIRPEQVSDHDAITHVTKLAFASHPHSSQTEHFIILALRRAGALSLSLVAEHQSQIVGHVAFSPVTISDHTPDWYILGPIAVHPDLQRQGVGSQFIETGIAQLRQMNAAGCVLLGDPAYYHRFGFRNHPQLTLPDVPQEYFLALPLQSQLPQGQVTYHAAFHAQS